MTLYIMVGIPGSGKSTVAKNLGAIVVSSDTVREILYGSEEILGESKVVFSWVDSIVKDALIDGRDVIYDATCLTKKTREGIVKKFRETADEIVCIFVDTPLEKCIKRNSLRSRKVPEDVIRSMSAKLERPMLEEGFDRINTITD